MSKILFMIFFLLFFLNFVASRNIQHEEDEGKCVTKLLSKLLPAIKLYRKIISKLDKMRDTVEFWKIIFYIIETPSVEQLKKFPGVLGARPSKDFAKSLVEEIPNAVVL